MLKTRNLFILTSRQVGTNTDFNAKIKVAISYIKGKTGKHLKLKT